MKSTACPHDAPSKAKCRICRAEYMRQWYQTPKGQASADKQAEKRKRPQALSRRAVSRWRQFDKRRIIARHCIDCGYMPLARHFHTTIRKDGSPQVYRRCRHHHLALLKKRFAAKPEEVKRLAEHHKSMLRYNLTGMERYRLRVVLYFRQRGLCVICLQPFELRRMGLDHDHATGRIRGLLCSLCNYGLGAFKDDTDRLARAIRYLTR